MKTAAILGCGVIGGGWLARFLLAGWNVRVYDPSEASRTRVLEVLERARRALPMLYDHALPAEGQLSFHDTIADAVNGADWIQENVPERLDLKHATFREVQAANNRAIIGSSTSGFKPSELQAGMENAAQIIVCHPFNPVYLLPLVEVVASPINGSELVEGARTILTEIGMYPLTIAKEIDAHIADRLLEAVWREALWLIKDGIATTGEIDEAIRMGFGLRWAQMGLFETYRIAGGAAGMRHFLAQFGPALAWPWTKLMDVPDLDEALIIAISEQSDAQSGHLSIAELESKRDNNLVALMRALKGQNSAVGAHLNAIDARLAAAPKRSGATIETIARKIPADWGDYNGHMNESRYGQLYSDAADRIMALAGADADYIAGGNSFFTVDIHIKFVQEVLVGEDVTVHSRVAAVDGKKLRLAHEIRNHAGEIVSTGEQLLIHVSLITRKSTTPAPAIIDALSTMKTSAI